MEQQNRHWLCQTYCSLGFGPCGCCFCWLLFLLGLTYRVNGCMSVNGCINGCTTFFWGSSRSTKLKGYKDRIGSAGPQRVNQLESPVRSREGRTDKECQCVPNCFGARRMDDSSTQIVLAHGSGFRDTIKAQQSGPVRCDLRDARTDSQKDKLR